ncbi:MAG: thiolase family protein [Bacteroidota bacterium]
MDAYIVAGYRTAFGKAKKGSLRFTRPDDMATHVIKHLIDSLPDFDVNRVDDLIVGNALPEAEQGLNMARMIALTSLPMHVGGVTVNRYCASGLETIAMASAKIHAGHADVIVAGGTESMSLIPMGGYKIVPNHHVTNEHPDWYFGMGLTAEAVAREYDVSREECDEFAVRSHQRAAKALEADTFKDEIVPMELEEVYYKDGKKQTRKFTHAKDEGVRPDSTVDALAKLRPVFAKDGVVTAGNSSQTTDGAAFVLVVSEAILKEYNLTPIAQLKGYGVAGVNPKIMGIGPVEAVPKALKTAGLSLNDITTTELNEAFATQSVAVIKKLGLDPETTNPHGGAIAMGHPLGCTGAKLSIQAINETKRRGGKYGMVTACVGGGQGIAGIFEVL